MGLADTIRTGVATANNVTATLQVTVLHKPWIGEDGYGKDVFVTTALARKALVSQDRKPLYTATGKLIMTTAYLAFLKPIPPTMPNTGQVRTNPVDPRDIFILPDGTTGPIVKSSGFLDAGTGKPFLNEVWLGEVGGGE